MVPYSRFVSYQAICVAATYDLFFNYAIIIAVFIEESSGKVKKFLNLRLDLMGGVPGIQCWVYWVNAWAH